MPPKKHDRKQALLRSLLKHSGRRMKRLSKSGPRRERPLSRNEYSKRKALASTKH